MPRSDKSISTGSLSDPIASARSPVWSSHLDPEDAQLFEPDGMSFVDPLTQVPVEAPVEAVVNLLDQAAPTVTVREQDALFDYVESLPTSNWVTTRSIEGRTYSRHDVRHQGPRGK